MLLKEEKAYLVEAEKGTKNEAFIFGLPKVAELYNAGFGKPGKFGDITLSSVGR